MNDLPDRRLLGYCLVASITGFVVWVLVLEPASALWFFLLSIAVLAGLLFLDGVASARGG